MLSSSEKKEVKLLRIALQAETGPAWDYTCGLRQKSNSIFLPDIEKGDHKHKYSKIFYFIKIS